MPMDIKVRQRLIGALVLIGCAVVIIPIVFKSNNMKPTFLALTPVAPAAPAEPLVLQEVVKQQHTIEKVAHKLGTLQTAAKNHSSTQLQKHTWMVQIYKSTSKSKLLALQETLAKQHVETYIINIQESNSKPADSWQFNFLNYLNLAHDHTRSKPQLGGEYVIMSNSVFKKHVLSPEENEKTSDQIEYTLLAGPYANKHLAQACQVKLQKLFHLSTSLINNG